MPDALTPQAWQGFIAITDPNSGNAPLELHSPGIGLNAIVLVRLTTAPWPGTAYTYALTPTTGSPIAFTLPDRLGIDQFSAEGQGVVSITAPVRQPDGQPSPNLREPILVARADLVVSLTISPLP